MLLSLLVFSFRKTFAWLADGCFLYFVFVVGGCCFLFTTNSGDMQPLISALCAIDFGVMPARYCEENPHYLSCELVIV